MQPKLLLTSVCRPFGGPGEGDSVGAELFHAQVTRAQGPFSLRQTIRVWALDYLAENVNVPTVALHYPSRREFITELERGGYTHVGINFVVATFHKVRAMAGLIRAHAPGAKIILGGYGTVLPDEVLAPYGDYICREEGIGFLRRLFGEPAEAALNVPYAPIPSVQVLSYQQSNVVGHVTAGLGCTNGCDFCCTSHFFKQKYVRFLHTGREIFDALIAARERAAADGEVMDSHVIIDEDFFLHQKRAREFLDCVRESGEVFSLMGFGSVRGLSLYTAREIAEMGFTLVWNAFEGKGAGYQKMRGRTFPELYADMKSVGCAQLTSMIIGFPYQDEALMRAEFDELMKLEPALTQILIYFAFPGTPFHEQVISEGRYRREYDAMPDLRRWDGFAMHFKHPKFDDPGQIEAIQREFYDRDFSRLGPSVMRLAKVWLEGFRNLKNDENPVLRRRAERLREDTRSMIPALNAIDKFPPSPEVREAAARLRADIIRHTGELSLRERLMEQGAPLIYLRARALARAGVLQQPGLLRMSYRLPGAEASAETGEIFRLQGGRFAGLRAMLRDDVENKIVRHAGRWRELLPDWLRDVALNPPAPASVAAVTSRATGLEPSVG